MVKQGPGKKSKRGKERPEKDNGDGGDAEPGKSEYSPAPPPPDLARGPSEWPTSRVPTSLGPDGSMWVRYPGTGWTVPSVLRRCRSGGWCARFQWGTRTCSCMRGAPSSQSPAAVRSTHNTEGCFFSCRHQPLPIGYLLNPARRNLTHFE